MASRKQRRAAKRATSNGAAKRQRGGRPVVPPDDPLLRHEELSADRRFVGEEKPVPGGSLVAALAVLRGRRSTARRRSSSPGSVERQAACRLQALAESKSMNGRGAAVVSTAARRAYSTLDPGIVEMVVPTPGISNWVQLGPTAIPKGQTYSPARVFVSGRITAIVIDPTNPNTIYLGSAQGGVWKTTDGGLSWRPRTDNEASLAIGALAMDPSNPLVLYAGTGEGNFSGDSYYGAGVLKTVDGGATWMLLGQATFIGTRFGRIGITPGATSRLFAATGNGLYRSTDAGVNWTKMSGGGLPAFNCTDVSIDPVTPTTVYASFWGIGIYKCTNANAATPTWSKLAGGLPTTGFTRIALGLSPSSPQTIYALYANTSYQVDTFTRSIDGGTTWTNVALPGGNIGGQGFYNLNVTADPTTPDIVYLSGISLWKAVRNTVTNAWTITDVGAPIHPDNHASAIQTSNHQVIYAGSDGGIYRSTDGGATWSDAINEGPCIAQFEFIDQHPTSDAVVFGGTQDNGTEQFRNSPVFNHADDGDGGSCAVDRLQPRNVISTYYGPSPKRSTQGGKFGTWSSVSAGLSGAGLFYPPLALDDTNPSNIAFGTNTINLDGAQGTGGWPTKVALPSISGSVSAIHYVNSNLIYAGTTSGQVYRLHKTGSTWAASAIHAPPLPTQWIWDISARPDDANTVVVAMSGFGTAHVWKGTVAPSGTSATWTSISGTGSGVLPDIPVNALVIDPIAPYNTYYIATDVAVYRTTDAGGTWAQFSQGLPNCAVFDLRLHQPTRLLRAATHGRGLWERRLDAAAATDVDLFFRDHVMATGRRVPASPETAAFEDPLQYVALGDQLWWWQCADIKVDAIEGGSYQMPVAVVDYAAFESALQHRNAQRGRVNRVYVQVHNRGIASGANVTVKLLYADASAGLPPLPPDFWTAFPNDSTNTSTWHPVGTAKVIPSLSPTEPTVLEWDWTTPTGAADHTCLLAVMDSSSDPTPAGNKVFDVNLLVRNEKRVGLKNLHVVNALPGASLFPVIRLHAISVKPQAIRLLSHGLSGWNVGVLVPKKLSPANGRSSAKKSTGRGRSVAAPVFQAGWSSRKPTKTLLASLRERYGRQLETFDTSKVHYLDDASKGGMLNDLAVPKEGASIILVLTAPAAVKGVSTLHLVQEEDGRVIGGNTFAFRPAPRRG